MAAETHSLELIRDGFTILPRILSEVECANLVTEVSGALERTPGNGIEAGQGGIVGGRNLIEHWNGWPAVTEHTVIGGFLREHVGRHAGLVRILYFDKPPGRSWSLSLHRDRTIAVAQHHQPPTPFAKPTTKAGVPHVEATDELLQRMLTLRIHLDPMTDENGPLVVIPGSHVDDSTTPSDLQIVRCNPGDVFAMRPLLSHGSRAANENTKLHRRVLHLEIAPEKELSRPYRWHRFEPITWRR